MKLIEAPKKSYCELYQDSDIKFSFVVPEGEGIMRQTHSFTKCRDFLNDALVSSQFGCVSPRIYGFEYRGDEYPIDFSKARLALSGSNFDRLSDNIVLLNKFEEENSLTQTDIYAFEDSEYLYVEGDSGWVRSTVMISLYTHILRCLYTYTSEESTFSKFMRSLIGLEGNAANYQKKINYIDFELLIAKSKEIFPEGSFPFPEEEGIQNIQTLHNHTGIVSWVDMLDNIGSGHFSFYPESAKTFVRLAGSD